jgi:hypothetical protein
MDDLAMPPLIKAGLVHAQFETIHRSSKETAASAAS